MADLYGELLTVGSLARQGAVRPTTGHQSGTARVEPPMAPVSAVRDETVRQFATARASGDRCPLNPTYNKYEQRFGNGHAEIVDYLIVEGDRANPTTLPAGADVEFYFKVRFHRDVETPILGITFTNSEGVVVYAVNNAWMKQALAAARAGDVRVYRYRVGLSLAAGDWFLEPGMAETTTDICDCRTALATFHLTDRAYYGGLARLEIEFGEVSIGVAAPDDSSSVSP
jgi:hypothetical protein